MSVAPGSRTANSSPPRRAAKAPSGISRSRRSAKPWRSESPTWWPRRSLISLNPSRSSNNSAPAPSSGPSVSSNSVRRSENERRFKSLVNESWFASCARCSAWRADWNTRNDVTPSSGSRTRLNSTATTNSGASARSAPSAVMLNAKPSRMVARNPLPVCSASTRHTSIPFITNTIVPPARMPIPHVSGIEPRSVIAPWMPKACNTSPPVESASEMSATLNRTLRSGLRLLMST